MNLHYSSLSEVTESQHGKFFIFSNQIGYLFVIANQMLNELTQLLLKINYKNYKLTLRFSGIKFPMNFTVKYNENCHQMRRNMYMNNRHKAKTNILLFYIC